MNESESYALRTLHALISSSEFLPPQLRSVRALCQLLSEEFESTVTEKNLLNLITSQPIVPESVTPFDTLAAQFLQFLEFYAELFPAILSIEEETRPKNTPDISTEKRIFTEALMKMVNNEKTVSEPIPQSDLQLEQIGKIYKLKVKLKHIKLPRLSHVTAEWLEINAATLEELSKVSPEVALSIINAIIVWERKHALWVRFDGVIGNPAKNT